MVDRCLDVEYLSQLRDNVHTCLQKLNSLIDAEQKERQCGNVNMLRICCMNMSRVEELLCTGDS